MTRDEAIKVLSNISTVGRMNGKHLITKALHMANGEWKHEVEIREKKVGEWRK